MATSVENRRSGIIELLGFERYLKAADLSRHFGVSQMSIRRDLDYLEEEGLLRRVRGGLIAIRFLHLGLSINTRLANQIRSNWLEKDRIARAAAALVQSGDHLIFDSGILSYFTACSLPGDLLIKGELTVITNSLLVVMELAPWPGVETILLGGEYQADRMMNSPSPSTLRTLESLHADKMFLAVDEIVDQPKETILDNVAELETKMIAACTKVIMLSSGSQFNQGDQIKSLPISSAYTLIAGKSVPAELVSYLHSYGADVILA
jgi:DeoR/GlpR family transcriptional regulator of sugar metabolism